MKILIMTSGNGCLPAGRVVGHVEANSPEQAEEQVIRSRSLPEKYRGFFHYKDSTVQNSSEEK